MIYWRNLNADDLSKRELRLALEDAIAEIERATQKRSNDVYYSAFLCGFGTSFALAALAFVVSTALT